MTAPCATGCPFLACPTCPYQGGTSAWSCQVCQQPAPEGDPVCKECAGQTLFDPTEGDTMSTSTKVPPQRCERPGAGRLIRSRRV